MALGKTVSNSDPGSLPGFQASGKKLSNRLVGRLLKGKFAYKSAGRFSCGVVPSTATGRVLRLPGSVSLESAHHCNSVSSCAACRQRILGQRSSEIQAMIDLYLAGVDLEMGDSFNREVMLLTLTVPHTKSDTLQELLGSSSLCTGLRGARSHLFGQSYFAKQTRGWLTVAVNGIEVTYGKNGPHPHLHCLLFLDLSKAPESVRNGNSVDVRTLRSYIANAWIQSAQKAGLDTPHFDIGCDLQPGANAGHYISKWGVGAELSDTGRKVAKNGSFSIAEMEQLVAKNDALPQFKSNLQEYYDSVYGVKVHNFSHKLRHLRGLYQATKFNQVVFKSLGQCTQETRRYLNEAGPGYLDSLGEMVGSLDAESLDFALPGLVPDNQAEWGIQVEEEEVRTLDFVTEFVWRDFMREYFGGTDKDEELEEEERYFPYVGRHRGVWSGCGIDV